MNWSNLKQNKCPNCDHDFLSGKMKVIDKLNIVCTKPCGFKISPRRFSEIISSQINASLEKQWDKEAQEENL